MFRVSHGSFHFTPPVLPSRFCLSPKSIFGLKCCLFFFVPLSLRNIISLQVINEHISKIVKVDKQSVLRASDEQQEAGLLDISRWNLSI